jgi:nucleotide-binding universal stress UspA family protein
MYSRILVPIDGSPTSEAGVSEAIRLARLCGARIRLIHLVDVSHPVTEAAQFGEAIPELIQLARQAGQELLDRAKARVAQAGIPVDAEAYEGLGTHLVDFVNGQVDTWKADVIVLGTHGRRGIGRALLGSDAEQILRRSSVPVLLVRGAGSS